MLKNTREYSRKYSNVLHNTPRKYAKVLQITPRKYSKALQTKFTSSTQKKYRVFFEYFGVLTESTPKYSLGIPLMAVSVTTRRDFRR